MRAMHLSVCAIVIVACFTVVAAQTHISTAFYSAACGPPAPTDSNLVYANIKTLGACVGNGNSWERTTCNATGSFVACYNGTTCAAQFLATESPLEVTGCQDAGGYEYPAGYSSITACSDAAFDPTLNPYGIAQIGLYYNQNNNVTGISTCTAQLANLEFLQLDTCVYVIGSAGWSKVSANATHLTRLDSCPDNTCVTGCLDMSVLPLGCKFASSQATNVIVYPAVAMTTSTTASDGALIRPHVLVSSLLAALAFALAM